VIDIRRLLYAYRHGSGQCKPHSHHTNGTGLDWTSVSEGVPQHGQSGVAVEAAPASLRIEELVEAVEVASVDR